MCLVSASSSSCVAKDQNHMKVRDKYTERMKDKKFILSSILFIVVVAAAVSIVCLYACVLILYHHRSRGALCLAKREKYARVV